MFFSTDHRGRSRIHHGVEKWRQHTILSKFPKNPMKSRVIINKLSLQTFRILRVVAHSLGFYVPCIHIGCKHAEEAVRFAEVHYRQRATDTGSGFSCNNHIAVANCTHCYVMYLKSYLLQMHIQEVKPSPTTQKRPTGQNI